MGYGFWEEYSMTKASNKINNGMSSIDYSYIRPKKAVVLKNWHNSNLNGETFYEKKELITESYEKIGRAHV